MKQKLFSFLFIGMTMLSALTLSSCGGDDDDLNNNSGITNNNGTSNSNQEPTSKPNQDSNTNASDYHFILPPLGLGASYDDVKKELNSWSGWHENKDWNNSSSNLFYDDDINKLSISYNFETGKASTITVTYHFDQNTTLPSEELVNDFTKHYNCIWVGGDDSSENENRIWVTSVRNIGGKKTNIAVYERRKENILCYTFY